MSTTDQLVQLSKNSFFLPPIPGKLHALAIPGIQGRYATEVPGGFINRVGGAELHAEHVQETIAAVQAHFASLHNRYVWMVASTDTPDTLEQYLAQAGFSHNPSWNMAGMVLTDLDQDIPTHPDVQIMRATPDERPNISRIYQAGFEMAASAADLFADMMIDTPTMTHYLVYVPDVAEPVGAASMFYIEEYGAVVLEASAILEPYRGRGIYKQLIAQRIQDARADGMAVAVVQANTITSAPGLSKYGFVKTCDFRPWVPAM